MLRGMLCACLVMVHNSDNGAELLVDMLYVHVCRLLDKCEAREIQ